MKEMRPYLNVEDLEVRFGGIVAIRDLSFQVEKGEIFAIIGPNGAGKTTIFNCINGISKPEKGKISFMEVDLLSLRPHQVVSLGIARTFQNIELFMHMTVMENLLLGRHWRMKGGIISSFLFTKMVKKEELEAREKIEEIIDFLDIQAIRNQIVANLPFGMQKLVELGRAMAMEPQLILLDEPAGGLSVEEREDLALRILEMRRHLRKTLVIIEHDLRFVMDISDRVMVMDRGIKIAEGIPQEVQRSPLVLKVYLGEENHSNA
jgi:branched-chain amino acid transport system ATP-binding protein